MNRQIRRGVVFAEAHRHNFGLCIANNIGLGAGQLVNRSCSSRSYYHMPLDFVSKLETRLRLLGGLSFQHLMTWRSIRTVAPLAFSQGNTHIPTFPTIFQPVGIVSKMLRWVVLVSKLETKLGLGVQHLLEDRPDLLDRHLFPLDELAFVILIDRCLDGDVRKLGWKEYRRLQPG